MRRFGVGGLMAARWIVIITWLGGMPHIFNVAYEEAETL
jgi:hypothetical protein